MLFMISIVSIIMKLFLDFVSLPLSSNFIHCFTSAAVVIFFHSNFSSNLCPSSMSPPSPLWTWMRRRPGVRLSRSSSFPALVDHRVSRRVPHPGGRRRGRGWPGPHSADAPHGLAAARQRAHAMLCYHDRRRLPGAPTSVVRKPTHVGAASPDSITGRLVPRLLSASLRIRGADPSLQKAIESRRQRRGCGSFRSLEAEPVLPQSVNLPVVDAFTPHMYAPDH